MELAFSFCSAIVMLVIVFGDAASVTEKGISLMLYFLTLSVGYGFDRLLGSDR